MKTPVNTPKTRIVATLGPASSDPGVIRQLIELGVDIFRLNFSHGSLDNHEILLRTVNDQRRAFPHQTAVMGDLCGPKIRTGVIHDQGQFLHPDDRVVIRADSQPGTIHAFGTTYPQIVYDVQPGQRLLIDDGNIMLEAQRRHDDQLICRVLIGGPLYSHKGINLPHTAIKLPSITEQDWRGVDWAIAHNLNFLALSFVRSPDDITQLRDYLRSHNSDIQIVAKIEKPQAIDNLPEIINVSDAILIARGDLGIEMDLADMPILQKHIAALCRDRAKPFIVATQMLQSMIERPIPTRAEVIDLSHAVFELTDAVMLSGETAVGKFPLESVRWMSRVVKKSEEYLDAQHASRPLLNVAPDHHHTAALARSVGDLIDAINARLVVTWTENGTTARMLSNARIDVHVIALTASPRVAERLNLEYAVFPLCTDKPANVKALTQTAEKLILDNQWAHPGDNIVVVTGRSLAAHGTTNAILIHRLSSSS